MEGRRPTSHEGGGGSLDPGSLCPMAARRRRDDAVMHRRRGRAQRATARRRRAAQSCAITGGSPDQAVSASKVRRFRGGHYGTQVMQWGERSSIFTLPLFSITKMEHICVAGWRWMPHVQCSSISDTFLHLQCAVGVNLRSFFPGARRKFSKLLIPLSATIRIYVSHYGHFLIFD
jgi:hypothetical protein